MKILTKEDKAKTVALRNKGLTCREIGEVFGISHQAIGLRLQGLGFKGMLNQKCSHCKKYKSGILTRVKWGKICQPCHNRKKRTRKFEWSCDHSHCKVCKRTDRIHKTHGVCCTCVDRIRYQSSPAYREKRIATIMKYYKANRPARLKAMKAYNRKKNRLKNKTK